MNQIKDEISYYFQKILEAPIWKGAFSILTTILVTLFGEFDRLVKYFLLALIFDFCTGVVKAIINGNCHSRRMRKSASKIISYGLAIMFGHFAEVFNIAGARAFILSILGLTELKSTKENLDEIGAKFPEFMNEIIDEWHERAKKFKWK